MTLLARAMLCRLTMPVVARLGGSRRWRSDDNSSNGTKTVRLGCASGFWGDTPTAPQQLIYKSTVDYLIYDYLSELTMSLLTAAKQKRPEMGYATDFVQYGVGPYLKEIRQRGIKVITNAGGINTSSCVKALHTLAEKAGVEGLKIAEVRGDDLMPRSSELLASGNIREMHTGKTLPHSVHSMTAYFGASPIVHALQMGADIVVTGRTADSALALAPLIHEFGWAMDDYDRLASGSLAGHLIECGGQATGGLFTDWELVGGYENLGFPIVDVSPNGDILLTKPKGTGGLVNRFTVAEQMLYEIGDPQNYILPDVICDFSNVAMFDSKEHDGVKVLGARGKPPTSTYKVSATYLDGFKGTGVAIVLGGDAPKKARKTAEAIMKRTGGIFKHLSLPDFQRSNVSILGAEDIFGLNRNMTLVSPREAVIWMSVLHEHKQAIDIWAREIASAGTGMAPGLCGMVGGRPKATPCLKLFSFLFPKSEMPATVTLGEVSDTIHHAMGDEYTDGSHTVQFNKMEERSPLPRGNCNYRLVDLAYARSGDKGDDCNIGVIPRHPSFLPYIKDAATPELVFKYFEHLFGDGGRVVRYDVPGINALNFVLHNVLDGGGIASLRPDPLGKAFAQMLLDFPIKDMPTLDDVKRHAA